MTIHQPTITRRGDAYVLVYDEVYATSRADLWDAVTSPDRLARWMAPYSGDLHLGGTWEVSGSDGVPWCRGTVTDCEPGRTFTTTWHATDEDPTELVVTVQDTDGGARLTLVHTGIRSIFYGAGWQTYLELLERGVAAPSDQLVDDVQWERRFGQLRPLYDELFAAVRDGDLRS